MRTLVVMLIAFGLLAGSCGRDDPGIAALPPADALTQQAVAGAVNELGFDLLHELARDDGNTVVSPLSASTMLGMLLAGARGETATAIADTLHVEPGPATSAAYAALLSELGAPADVELAVANSLWAAPGFPLEPDFVDVMGDAFQATLDEVDLGSQAGADRIDAWADEHTNGLIQRFADALGLPDPQAVLVLLNAVYFKGEWTIPFEPALTFDRPFTTGDGREVTVPMMHGHDTFAMGSRDGSTVLRMPYGDDERFAMHIFLPNRRTDLRDLVSELDASAWRAATTNLQTEGIDVEMPRLDLAFRVTLNETLEALGMGMAFSDSDYTGLSSANPDLTVVAQEARLIVNEEGTEAAAVTGGVMTVSARPTFTVDRPFLFTISDSADETGVILFMGTVTDPTIERTEVD